MNIVRHYMDLALPNVVAFGGKKKSGKDFAADCLVRDAGFTKLHIVEPWIRWWMAAHDLDPERWEELKAVYRSELQRDAALAREEDPMRLIRVLPARVDSILLAGGRVAITGVRFINEVLYLVQQGALAVKVEVSEAKRRQRFIDSGEDLAHFNDPFEAEIDQIEWPLTIDGGEAASYYAPAVSAGYVAMLAEKARLRKAA